MCAERELHAQRDEISTTVSWPGKFHEISPYSLAWQISL
jgi:hypothetical protein